MKVNPYLNFNGNCREAFTFYEQVLGGKIVGLFTCGDAPPSEHSDPAWRDKIMHVTLQVGDTALMGSDSPPQYFQEMNGMYVSLSLDDPTEAERIFAALAEGGAVRMPIAETFWATRFGMVVDRFGTPWMINCEKAR